MVPFSSGRDRRPEISTWHPALGESPCQPRPKAAVQGRQGGHFVRPHCVALDLVSCARLGLVPSSSWHHASVRVLPRCLGRRGNLFPQRRNAFLGALATSRTGLFARHVSQCSLLLFQLALKVCQPRLASAIECHPVQLSGGSAHMFDQTSGCHKRLQRVCTGGVQVSREQPPHVGGTTALCPGRLCLPKDRPPPRAPYHEPRGEPRAHRHLSRGPLMSPETGGVLASGVWGCCAHGTPQPPTTSQSLRPNPHPRRARLKTRRSGHAQRSPSVIHPASLFSSQGGVV